MLTSKPWAIRRRRQEGWGAPRAPAHPGQAPVQQQEAVGPPAASFEDRSEECPVPMRLLPRAVRDSGMDASDNAWLPVTPSWTTFQSWSAASFCVECQTRSRIGKARARSSLRKINPDNPFYQDNYMHPRNRYTEGEFDATRTDARKYGVINHPAKR